VYLCVLCGHLDGYELVVYSDCRGYSNACTADRGAGHWSSDSGANSDRYTYTDCTADTYTRANSTADTTTVAYTNPHVATYAGSSEPDADSVSRNSL
jgi:phage/plasmid primase-like uncharacterized protein